MNLRGSLLLPLTLGLLSAAGSEAPCAPPDFTGHAGLLAMKADPVTDVTLAFYGLSYPPFGILQSAIPVYGPVSTILTAGYTGWGGWHGGIGSAMIRADLHAPSPTSWGASAIGYWMGGGAIVEGEGGGSYLYGGALVGSSPVGMYRIHLTAAMHTLPGFEDDEWAPSFMASLERNTDRYSLFVEALYAVPGVKSRNYETLVLLAGAQVYWNSVAVKFGTGVIRFVDEEETYPAPPLLAVIFPF